jgi:hypothetical protein
MDRVMCWLPFPYPAAELSGDLPCGTCQVLTADCRQFSAYYHEFGTFIQVESFDIANFYRLRFDGSGGHYNKSRPEVFCRLDEMCQHEQRVAAQADGYPGFDYKFSRHWADHRQRGEALDPMPGPWLELYLPVCTQGRWCEAVTAEEAVLSLPHAVEGLNHVVVAEVSRRIGWGPER